GGIDVVADDEVQAIVADKPKRIRKKRKAANGAGGSSLPTKKLRKDHGTSGIDASTGGKSVAALQSLLEGSTLPVEVGVAAAATVPFITSSVTPDSISESGLRTRHPTKSSEVWIMIRQRFEGKYAMQANWLKEMDAKIASLKAQISLKEAETAEAIHLRGQIANVEAAKTARINELDDLKEKNVALERKFAALDFASASKDVKLASSNSQVAKVTQDLSNLQLSCDELSVKASSLEFEKDRLIDQEHVEIVQVMQVKVVSDRVMDLDVELMRMALHLDEEFYPCYLTIIAGRMWILSRGLRLVVMKCLQLPVYLASLGRVIGRAIDKGIHDGLAAGINHRKVGRVLVEVAAYDPVAKANYVATVNAFCAVDFPFLAQLASHKDSSMADLMDLLRLEGHAAEAPEAEQLQPSLNQLMLPIHWLEDQVVIGETSLSFSLDLAYDRVRKIKENAASR
nr:hypothetical protein [Tanacetum cinerariifolium]